MTILRFILLLAIHSFPLALSSDINPYSQVDRTLCFYENEHCNDFHERAQFFEIDVPSIGPKELVVYICEGEGEDYACNPIKDTSYSKLYEY